MAETETIVLKYVADTKQTQSQLKLLESDNEAVAESTEDVNSQLDLMPGAAGAASKGVKALGASLKALLANPIVLLIAGIVAGLTALYKAFTRTAGGGDAMAKIFEGITATLGPLLDSLGKLAAGIVEFLKGNFSEAIDMMSGSFDNLAGSMAEAFENAGKLVDIRRELRDMAQAMTVEEAKINRQIAAQRVILEDLTKSGAERLAANNKVLELNDKLLSSREAQIKLQLKQIDIQKNQAGLSDEELEDVEDREAQLLAARENAAANRENLIRRVQTFERSIRAQIAKEEEENATREIESLQASETQKTDIQLLEAERLASGLKGIDEARTRNDELGAQARITIAEKETASKVANAKILAGILSDLSGVAEQGTKEAKALGVASAIISTLVGSVQVLGDPSLPFFAKLGAMVTVLTTGFATVKRITSTKVPGIGSGGFSVPTLSTASVSSVNGGFQNSTGQLPQNVSITNLNELPPVRATIMQGEVYNAVDAQNQLQKQTTL